MRRNGKRVAPPVSHLAPRRSSRQVLGLLSALAVREQVQAPKVVALKVGAVHRLLERVAGEVYAVGPVLVHCGRGVAAV